MKTFPGIVICISIVTLFITIRFLHAQNPLVGTSNTVLTVTVSNPSVPPTNPPTNPPSGGGGGGGGGGGSNPPSGPTAAQKVGRRVFRNFRHSKPSGLQNSS